MNSKTVLQFSKTDFRYLKITFKVERKNIRLNFSCPHLKRCRFRKRRAILKNPSTVLQKRLLSFHWPLLEIFVMKRGSVLSQNSTHVCRKLCYKEAGPLFYLFCEFTCFNNCLLSFFSCEIVKVVLGILFL